MSLKNTQSPGKMSGLFPAHPGNTRPSNSVPHLLEGVMCSPLSHSLKQRVCFLLLHNQSLFSLLCLKKSYLPFTSLTTFFFLGKMGDSVIDRLTLSGQPEFSIVVK